MLSGSVYNSAGYRNGMWFPVCDFVTKTLPNPRCCRYAFDAPILSRDVSKLAVYHITGCVVPICNKDTAESCRFSKYAEAPMFWISLRCSDVVPGWFRNSEARTWLDATERGKQHVSRLDPPFEHGLFYDILHTFGASMDPIFRVLR